MSETIHLVVDGAMMAEMLKSPEGVVGRHMIQKGTEFQLAARRQAPRRTGCLQDSIVKRVENVDGQIAIRVVSDTTPCSPTRTSYSLYVHEGTKPHIIRAVNAPKLVFFWPNGPRGAKTYAFKQINHPGTKPNRFFTDNLHIFGM